MRALIIFTNTVLAIAFLMAAAVAAYAAPPMAGEIRGSVKDALERPLPGVTLLLKNPGGALAGKTVSDTHGNFVFKEIAPGNYTVWAEKADFKKSIAVAAVVSGTATAVTLTMTSEKALETAIIAERLVRARNSLSPITGGSVYHFDHDDIENLPEGEDTTFNQMLLQAPGVVNDSYKQFHIRGDEGNVQYRINGIMLPEGITTGFGPLFDTRYFNRVDLLTGALPSQFGFHTAGVVDIETKAGQPGGDVSIYGGSHGTVKPGFELGGTQESMTYYVTGSFLTDNLGIENPTSEPSAVHDHTDQETGFGYFSYFLGPTTRLSLMMGSYNGDFQIPETGQQPDPDYLSALGLTGYNPDSLNNRQHETNSFGILALQSSIGPDFDYQAAFVSRLNTAHFTPDVTGDLAFFGAASDVYRSALSDALQLDGSYRLPYGHTVRLGFYGQYEDIKSNNTTTAFYVDQNGNVIPGSTPVTIVDDNPKNGNTLFGVYVQDEWKLAPKLTVNYGLRFDQMSAFVSANQFSPRLGVVYQVSPCTTLHAGYARYFTPPQTEMIVPGTIAKFAGTSNEPAVTQSSPVVPERSHYFDLGVLQKVAPGFNIGLDGYYKIVRDMLDEAQFGPALIFSDLNYNDGYIYGVELTGNYKSGNLGTYANFAYNIAKATDIVSGQWSWAWTENNPMAQLNYIANNWINLDHDQIYTASAGASYNLFGTVLLADATYGSGLRTGFANLQKMPENFQLNLGARRVFQLGALGPVEARADIINVTDDVNAIRYTGGGVFAPQYGPRLAVYAGLKKYF